MITRELLVGSDTAEMSAQSGVVATERVDVVAPGPVADLLGVGQWCQAGRSSTRGGDRRLECTMTDRSVTIYEVLPPRAGFPGRTQWRRDAIARLRYDDQDGTWSLHWPSGRQFRRDPQVAATPDVGVLLAVVDDEPVAA